MPFLRFGVVLFCCLMVRFSGLIVVLVFACDGLFDMVDLVFCESAWYGWYAMVILVFCG